MMWPECSSEVSIDLRDSRAAIAVVILIGESEDPEILQSIGIIQRELQLFGVTILLDDRALPIETKLVSPLPAGCRMRAELSRRTLRDGGIELTRVESGKTAFIQLEDFVQTIISSQEKSN